MPSAIEAALEARTRRASTHGCPWSALGVTGPDSGGWW